MNWFKRHRAMMDIIDHFGVKPQINKCLEELTELSEVIIKGLNKDEMDGKHLIEELADVEIMVHQMEIIFDVTEKVEDMVDYKLERTLSRMEGNSNE